jgi:phytol kinase
MWPGVAILWTYYLAALLALPVGLKAFTALPDEVVRKFQHVAYAGSIFLLLGLFERWTQAVTAAAGLALLAFPALWLWERHPSYRRLLADRHERGGEMRRQLLLAVLVFSLLIAFFWGLLGPAWRPAIAVAVMVWGLGDAAAALVGGFLGRHRFAHRLVEGAKTLEGTAAMVVAGAIAAFVTLFLYGGASWWVSLLAAVSLAPLAGAVELVSRRGSDTVTVPLATAAGLVPWWLLVVASRV